jgi:hypothetical protein
MKTSEETKKKISDSVKLAWKKGVFEKLRRGGRKIVSKLFEERGRKCEKCSWDKVNPYSKKVPVEINHINGDCSDWSPENLEILCPNCHSLTKYFKFYGRTHGNKSKRCTNKRYTK